MVSQLFLADALGETPTRLLLEQYGRRLLGQGATFVLAPSTGANSSKRRAWRTFSGKNDDLVLQYALNNLPSVGGSVLIAEGAVNLTAETTGVSNLLLAGCGPATTITQPNGTNLTQMLSWNGKSHVVVRDLTIDYGGANNTGQYHVKLLGASADIRFSHVVFANSYQSVSPSGATVWITGTTSDVAVEDCYLSVCAPVTTGTGGAPANSRLRFQRNHAVNPYNGVVGGSATGWSIKDNFVSGITGTAAGPQIDIAATADAVVSGNHLDGGLALIYTEGASGRIVITENVIQESAITTTRYSAIQAITSSSSATAELIVSKNHVKNCGSTTTGAIQVGRDQVGGVNLWNHSVISDNVVVGSKGHGIFVGNSSYPVIADNQVKDSSQTTNNTYDGIYLENSVVSPEVRGNTVRDTAANKARYSINLSGANVTGALVRENTLSGAVTKAINDAGTTSSIQDNPGYVTENGGAAAAVADGGTITHGLVATPTYVVCIGSVAAEEVAVTAVGATTFTVAIKNLAGLAGTNQTIYWRARV